MKVKINLSLLWVILMLILLHLDLDNFIVKQKSKEGLILYQQSCNYLCLKAILLLMKNK